MARVGSATAMAMGFRGYDISAGKPRRPGDVCRAIYVLVVARTRGHTEPGNSLQGDCEQYEAGQEDFPERFLHSAV